MTTVKARFRNATFDEALELLTSNKSHAHRKKMFKPKKRLWEEGVYENIGVAGPSKSRTKERNSDQTRDLRGPKKVTLPKLKFTGDDK